MKDGRLVFLGVLGICGISLVVVFCLLIYAAIAIGSTPKVGESNEERAVRMEDEYQAYCEFMGNFYGVQEAPANCLKYFLPKN